MRLFFSQSKLPLLTYTPSTFMTSSPRWLMTFTATLPDLGLANGRDTVRFRLSQASSSISPFSVVFSCL